MVKSQYMSQNWWCRRFKGILHHLVSLTNRNMSACRVMSFSCCTVCGIRSKQHSKKTLTTVSGLKSSPLFNLLLPYALKKCLLSKMRQNTSCKVWSTSLNYTNPQFNDTVFKGFECDISSYQCKNTNQYSRFTFSGWEALTHQFGVNMCHVTDKCLLLLSLSVIPFSGQGFENSNIVSYRLNRLKPPPSQRRTAELQDEWEETLWCLSFNQLHYCTDMLQLACLTW